MIEGELYFTAADPVGGRALWRLDPEADGGAQWVGTLPNSSWYVRYGYSELTPFGRDLYFAAADDVNGAELWAITPGGPLDVTVTGRSSDTFDLRVRGSFLEVIREEAGTAQVIQSVRLRDVRSLRLDGGTFEVAHDGDLDGLSLEVASGDTATRLQLASSQSVRSLRVGPAGAVEVVAAGGRVLRVDSLEITANAWLDVADATLVVPANPGSSPLATEAIRTYLRSGSAGGAWDGPGIRSSALGTAYTLGFRFDAGLLFVSRAAIADATFDGKVAFEDLVALAQNYNRTSDATFEKGDFDYDGAVDFADLVILAQHYNTTLSTASPQVLGQASPSSSMVPRERPERTVARNLPALSRGPSPRHRHVHDIGRCSPQSLLPSLTGMGWGVNARRVVRLITMAIRGRGPLR